MLEAPNDATSPVGIARLRAAAFGVAALSCFALAFVIYAPGIDDFFVYDDFFFLNAVRNRAFAAGMVRAFSFSRGGLFDEVTPFWRPLIDVYFYGFKPFGIHAQPYHVVNIVLHGAVGALGMLFISRLTRSALAGMVSGLVFVVAPTYDFAVTWMVQVSELLGAVFMLVALLAFHAWLTGEPPQAPLAAATVAFTILALLSKESTVILGALLPALSLVVDRRRGIGETVRALALPGAMCIAFGLAMMLHELTQPDHLQNAGWHIARNLWRYLKWMVFPYTPDAHQAAREVGAALFLAIGVGAVLVRQRALAFLFVWTLAALVPFIGFDEWIELRYTYVATLPFVAFVVTAALWPAGLLPRPVPVAGRALIMAAVLAALVVTPMRTRDQQGFLMREAARYERMVNSVVALCGPMAPGSQIFVRDPPYRDLGGLTLSALNLYYDRVYAWPVEEFPALIAFVEPKCAVEYDPTSETYHRVIKF